MDLLEALAVTLLLGLGTARMAAIVSVDEITAPLRDMIFHWFPPEDDERLGWYYQGMRRATEAEREAMASWGIPWWQKRWSAITVHDDDRPRRPSFIGRLIGCVKCTSVWIASGNVALYFAWFDGALALNLAMAASFVAVAANLRYYK